MKDEDKLDWPTGIKESVGVIVFPLFIAISLILIGVGFIGWFDKLQHMVSS